MSVFLSAEYGYSLPVERIATSPCRPRDAARLLCLKDGHILHKKVSALPELLPRGAQLFLNESRVLPVRLQLRKETGAAVEVFLIEGVGAHLCELLQTRSPLFCKALIRPSARVPLGSCLRSKNKYCQLHITRKTRRRSRASVVAGYGSLFQRYCLSSVKSLCRPIFVGRLWQQTLVDISVCIALWLALWQHLRRA